MFTGIMISLLITLPSTSSIDAKYSLEMFKNHANRIRSYIEDPSIGIEAVEEILDAAHALSLQKSRNFAIKKRSRQEQEAKLLQEAQPKKDEYTDIHPKQDYEQPNLDKHPLEPDQNILEFIANNNPNLAEWQKDILYIVDKESQYFIPQIETKIMNEGWASYWHHKILNELHLSEDLHLEFLVRHNQVLRPTPGGINPYHLGFIIWNDIERRWNEGDTGRMHFDDTPIQDVSSISENDTPGRKKIFEVRESDRDVSFLRRFLTEDIMRSLDIFQHEKRGKERVITKVSDKDNWKKIRDTFLTSVGTGSIPVIFITDANYGKSGKLYLKHEHDGRDLQLEYSEKNSNSCSATLEKTSLLRNYSKRQKITSQISWKFS